MSRDFCCRRKPNVAPFEHILDQANYRLATGKTTTDEGVPHGDPHARVVKKLGRALGASLVWSESTAAGQVVPGSSDLLRPVEDGANS